MNLKNQNVIHKTLGSGIIISQNDTYITVEFASKTSNFMYPNQDTFGKFLTLADPVVHSAVLQEAKEAFAAKQARRDSEILARKSSKSITTTKPISLKTERVPGKPMTFYVFQGNTFDIESAGGFIWAPQHSQSGNNFFHWDNLLLVKEGDIILHGCNSYIVATSIAISNCYDCDRPKERTFEDSWNNKGRRVDLKYTTFLNPIKTSNFINDIIKYCKVKYSPFDKDGNGNMGYLYELNRKLARVFLRAAVYSNPCLSDIDYIEKLLAEETEQL